MPRKPRSHNCDPRRVTVHHLWTRTVRRCFLFGRDSITGKDFSHREGWITSRLQHLAKFFAIDIFAFAAMSNHCHLVIRTRPDLVAQWDDQEVVRRWLSMLSRRRRSPEPTEKEIQAVRGTPGAVAKLRLRLSDPSWLMRMLCQHVAIRCNQEDECSGRVFQDRFQQSALESEADVLACMAYVDLNPLRAGMSQSLEEYADVSIGQRLRTLSGEAPETAAWLQPLQREQPSVVADQGLSAEHRETQCEAQCETQRETQRGELRGRLGCIGMSLEDYLGLLGRLAELQRPDLRGQLDDQPRREFRQGGKKLDVKALNAQLDELAARYVVRRPKWERELLEQREKGGVPAAALAADASATAG